MTGAIPGDLAREEQDRVAGQLRDCRRILETATRVSANIMGELKKALELLERDYVYATGGERNRRLCNQFIFEKLLILDGEVVNAILKEPWTTLYAGEFVEQMRMNVANAKAARVGPGLKMSYLVPRPGFKPAHHH